jgi:hypothetical protein
VRARQGMPYVVGRADELARDVEGQVPHQAPKRRHLHTPVPCVRGADGGHMRHVALAHTRMAARLGAASAGGAPWATGANRRLCSSARSSSEGSGAARPDAPAAAATPSRRPAATSTSPPSRTLAVGWALAPAARRRGVAVRPSMLRTAVPTIMARGAPTRSPLWSTMPLAVPLPPPPPCNTASVSYCPSSPQPSAASSAASTSAPALPPSVCALTNTSASSDAKGQATRGRSRRPRCHAGGLPASSCRPSGHSQQSARSSSTSTHA